MLLQFSDYVNANYINGFDKEHHYIAAQGPKAETLDSFWRLIIENKVDVVVMVTNCEEKGRQKCHKYWPNNQTDDMTLLQGAITVSLEGVEEFPDYTIRTLVAKTPNMRHFVKQFHYTSWPDHGVPESTAGVLTVRAP